MIILYNNAPNDTCKGRTFWLIPHTGGRDNPQKGLLYNFSVSLKKVCFWVVTTDFIFFLTILQLFHLSRLGIT